MATTPQSPAAPPKKPNALVTWLKSLPRKILALILEEFRREPVRYIAGAQAAVEKAVTKALPAKAAPLAVGVVKLVGAAATRDAVTPAAPPVSKLQSAADKAKARLR